MKRPPLMVPIDVAEYGTLRLEFGKSYADHVFEPRALDRTARERGDRILFICGGMKRGRVQDIRLSGKAAYFKVRPDLTMNRQLWERNLVSAFMRFRPINFEPIDWTSASAGILHSECALRRIEIWGDMTSLIAAELECDETLRVWIAEALSTPEVKQRAKRYGMDPAAYAALVYESGARCQICKKRPPRLSLLVIDHDHDTGAVRGALCTNCNTALGKLGDGLDGLRSAMGYLDGNS